MKRLFKALAAFFALLLIILAAGIFYITSVMDPNDYKPRIEQLALEQAGIELDIEGDVSWSLYPWLGMQTGAIRLAYPDKPELGQLDAAQISLQLMPLFSAQVQMSDLVLDGLSISLIKDADGNVNWLPTSEAHEAQPSPDSEAIKEETSSSEHTSLPALDIASVSIRGARVEYSDQQENKRIELGDVNLTTGQITLGATRTPVDLAFNLRVFEGASTLLEARSQASTEVETSADFQQIDLAELSIKTLLSGNQVPESLPEVSLNTRLQLDLSKNNVTLDRFALTFGELITQGDLLINDLSNPSINGSLEVSAFNLKSLMNQLEQPLPRLQDETVLETLAFSTEFQGSLENIDFNIISLSLDDTKFEGKAAIQLPSSHITLSLKGGDLNADRYMPYDDNASSGTETESSTSSSPTNGWPKEELFTLESLRSLNFSVTLDMQALTLAKRNLVQPGITLEATEGVINLHRLTSQIYSGSIIASGKLDARSDTASTQLKAQVNQIQVGQLLQEMAETEVFSGLLTADVDISTSGQSIHSMINTLNGRASIQMNEGILQGINMAQTVCQGIQTATSLGINTQQVDRSTPFADLSGSFAIRNGVVANDDLTAMLDAMRLRGQGQVNLPNQAIDYRLGFTLMENLFQQTCSVNNKLEGLELPINCQGQFDTPPVQMCRPDTSVFTQLLKQELQRKVEERIGGSVEEKIREKVGGEEAARDLIRGLLR